MRFLFILFCSALLITSCSHDEYNGVSGNTDHPMFYVKTNIYYPSYHIYEYDTVRFEYPEYFDINELIANDLILIEGLPKSSGLEIINPKPEILINPENGRELLIIGLEPNVNKTGWYVINGYYSYKISFNYNAIDEQYWDFSYIFDIRDSRVD